MTNYKTIRIVDGKPGPVIVDENGRLINKYPNKGELKLVTVLPKKDGRSGPRKEHYNETNTCDRCGKDFDNMPGHSMREHDKEGEWTGRWDCPNCYQKFDPNSSNNIQKEFRNCRTDNQNSYYNNMLGDLFQKLINTLRSLDDINKKNDNYHSPVDSIDPITGLGYQIRGKLYDSRNRRWDFSHLERDLNKEFHSMFICCASRNGEIIERIYKIPKEKIPIKIISIYKNPMNSRGTKPIIPWYEQYRIKDEEEIKKANNIWKTIETEEYKKMQEKYA